MIKKSYEFFSFILIFLLLGAVVLSIILSRPELLEYIGDKYIKSKGIEYSDIRGTLFSKIILKNVKYKNVFSAKRLSISYNIPMLLLKNPNISKVVVKDAEIKPENYHPAKNLVIPFSISKLEFDRLKVYLKGTELDVVVKASNLTYSKDMDINNLKLFISSKDYGEAEISGALSLNTLKGKAKLYPDKKYLKSLKEYSYPFVCNLKADIKGIELDSVYQIKISNYFLKSKQHISITAKGNFTSIVNSKIISFGKKLPFSDIFTTLRGDNKKIALHVEAGIYGFDIDGDYNESSRPKSLILPQTREFLWFYIK